MAWYSGIVNTVEGWLGMSPDNSSEAPARDGNISKTQSTNNNSDSSDDSNDNIFVRIIKMLMQALVALFKLLGDGLALTSLFSAFEAGGSVSKFFSGVKDSVTNFPHQINQYVHEKVHGWTAPPVIASAVIDAAVSHGADPAALLTISKMESGWDPNASSNASSAQGLFQMIKGTRIAQHLLHPFSPIEASDAGANLWVQTKNSLMHSLGRDITNAEVYLGHMQGAGGARALINGGNTNAVQALEQAGVRRDIAQKSIFDNIPGDYKRSHPDWQNISAQDFTVMWANKYNSYEAKVIGSNQEALNGHVPASPGAATDTTQVADSRQPAATQQPKPHDYASLKGPGLAPVITPETSVVATVEAKAKAAFHGLIEALDS